MKSRFVFAILFFALFFNIVHDLFMVNQNTVCDTTVTFELSMVENSADECCKDANELHENFHFSAILYAVNIDFYNPIQKTLTFVSAIPPTLSYQTSFKPPIA